MDISKSYKWGPFGLAGGRIPEGGASTLLPNPLLICSERREEEELRRLQAYEAELKSEMAELQHIKSELRHHSDSNRKRSSKVVIHIGWLGFVRDRQALYLQELVTNGFLFRPLKTCIRVWFSFFFFTQNQIT